MPAFSSQNTPEDRPPSGIVGWTGSLARRLLGRAGRAKDVAAPPLPRARFRNVCISRESGAGGGTVARMVGIRLEWRVYDHEFLDAIAKRMELPVEEVRALDELAPSVVQDWILPMREEYYAPHETYLDHLSKMIETVGKAGESILVGRGAEFLLPKEETLRVRLVAPLKTRAIRLAERLGVSVRTAKRAAKDLDRRRSQFVRTLYRLDADDPHNYDLVLDTQSLGLTIASELIIRAVEAGLPPKFALNSPGT